MIETLRWLPPSSVHNDTKLENVYINLPSSAAQDNRHDFGLAWVNGPDSVEPPAPNSTGTWQVSPNIVEPPTLTFTDATNFLSALNQHTQAGGNVPHYSLPTLGANGRSHAVGHNPNVPRPPSIRPPSSSSSASSSSSSNNWHSFRFGDEPTERVIRGGAWNLNPSNATSTSSQPRPPAPVPTPPDVRLHFGQPSSVDAPRITQALSANNIISENPSSSSSSSTSDSNRPVRSQGRFFGAEQKNETKGPSLWPPKEVAEIQADEKQRKQWSEASDHRIAVRVAHGVSDSLLESDDWSPSETMMNKKYNLAFLAAVDQLDTRYPQALPNADYALYSLYQFVNSLDIETHKKGKDEVSAQEEKSTTEKKHQKEAALRFLKRVAEKFSEDRKQTPPYTYPLNPGETHSLTKLSVKQALALAYYAIKDPTIFPTEEAQKRRLWALTEALAGIQRGHNDKGTNAKGEKDESIIWDPAILGDNPRCPRGTFIGSLSHLDTLHPDVYIETSKEEIRALEDNASNAILHAATVLHGEVFTTVQQQHGVVYDRLDPAKKKELNHLIEAYYDSRISAAKVELSEVYSHYRNQLLAAVRTAAPRTHESQLNDNTTIDGLALLISESHAASETIPASTTAPISHSSSSSSSHP